MLSMLYLPLLFVTSTLTSCYIYSYSQLHLLLLYVTSTLILRGFRYLLLLVLIFIVHVSSTEYILSISNPSIGVKLTLMNARQIHVAMVLSVLMVLLLINANVLLNIMVIIVKSVSFLAIFCSTDFTSMLNDHYHICFLCLY